MQWQRENEDGSLYRFQADANQLETMILNGRKAFGQNISINQEEALQHLRKMNSSLPAAVRDAEDLLTKQEQMLKEAEETLAKAKRDASNLSGNSKMESDNLLAETRKKIERDLKEQEAFLKNREEQMLAAAQQRAEAIVQSAMYQAQRIVSGAQQRADQLVNEDTVLARASAEANRTKEQARKEINDGYQVFYSHMDEMLTYVDNALSEQLTQLRILRQNLNEGNK